MFFLLLCVFLFVLFWLQVPFDKFGWLMIVALAWFCGFLDGRKSTGGLASLGTADSEPLPEFDV